MSSTGAATPLTATAGNPFPVYPVQALSELIDVRDATVMTPEVERVQKAVEQYIEDIASAPTAHHHLVLAAKGDFGTGKTHLMMYARSLLRGSNGPAEAVDGEGGGTANPLDESLSPLAIMATTNESPLEEWYRGVVGPALLALQPRKLVRQLMIDVACEVVMEDEYASHLAQEFRSSPQALLNAMRDGDEVDPSLIESRFRRTLADLLPGADEAFLGVVAALRTTDTAGIAERWLAGEQLTPAQAERLGARTEDDPLGRAQLAICLVASLARRSGQPFAFFIDEFEHLARHDRRNGSRRNITWVKRLVEALVPLGSFIFVCGHWEAWEQQGDFLDRFMGQPPIQLLRLDDRDILKIIEVRAPGWAATFPPPSARAMADITSGNIRRVMTLLFDLYANPETREAIKTSPMIHQAALLRLGRTPEQGILPALEAAARANGAELRQDALWNGNRFDAGVFLGDELRLLIEIAHARDEKLLLARGDRFGDLVRAAMEQQPRMRGLFIALGAVNPDHLKTLDAALAHIDVLNGEAEEVSQRAAERVAAACQEPDPAALEPSEIETLRDELNQLRRQLLERAEEQQRRVAAEFAGDERSETLAANVGDMPYELARERWDIDRRETLHTLTSARPQSVSSEIMGLFSFPILAALVASVAVLSNTRMVGFAFNSLGMMELYATILPILLGFGGLLLVGALIFQRSRKLVAYRSLRASLLRDAFWRGAPVAELEQLDSRMDRLLERVGLIRTVDLLARSDSLEELDHLVAMSGNLRR
jgi:hypothetical protein